MKRFIVFSILIVIGLFFAVSSYRTYGYFAYSQSSIDLNNLTGVFDTENFQGQFYNKLITSKEQDKNFLAYNVLGDTSDNKRIEVDLTNQRLYAFEGNNKIYDFIISSGKYGRTPTGEFTIWIKLRYTKMSGGNKALGTYYYLPNVPFTMFFANAEVPAYRGYGIHGTYWHNNFGHPMSHGCINMKTEEVEKIFYWANPALGDKPSIKATEDNPGTKVIIYGTAPAN